MLEINRLKYEVGHIMRKQLLIQNISQIMDYRKKIILKTKEKVNTVFQDCEGIELLERIKFSQSGYDPLFDEPINFIEMTNQVFTYLVCLSAAEILLLRHPSHSFYVNFGTESGYDVISDDASIICECFAATTPDSNGKLAKDTKRVYDDARATWKYVIFYTSNSKPGHIENIRSKYSNVEIIGIKQIC